jgi:hypothetical protein
MGRAAMVGVWVGLDRDGDGLAPVLEQVVSGGHHLPLGGNGVVPAVVDAGSVRVLIWPNTGSTIVLRRA